MDTPAASGDAPAPQLRPVGYRLLTISLVVLNVVVLLASTVVVYNKFNPQHARTTGAAVPYAALQKQNTASYQARAEAPVAEEPQGVKLKTYTSKKLGVQFEYPETWTVEGDSEFGISIQSPPLTAKLFYADALPTTVRATIGYSTGSDDFLFCYPYNNTIGSGSQLFTRTIPLGGITKDSLTRFGGELRMKDESKVPGRYSFNCLMDTYGYEFRKGTQVKTGQGGVIVEPANMEKVKQKLNGWMLTAGFMVPGPRHSADYDQIADDVNAIPEYEQMKQIMMSFRSVN